MLFMNPHPPPDPAALRHVAEARVKQRRATNPPPTEAERERLHPAIHAGQGSTFVFTFPWQPVESVPTATP